MLRTKPFAALRPRSDLAHRVACVPYDVVDTAEARALADLDELSFLHVTRAEVDLPPDTDVYGDKVYRLAAKNFRKFQDQGVMIHEDRPCIYIYRQEASLPGRQIAQTGIVCCFHIDDYHNNVIKKHEKTRKDKEDDRTSHTLALKANPGPVFLLHKGLPRLAELTEASVRREPLYDFTAPDRVRHSVWRVEQYAPFIDAFARLDAAYIADGHHRCASAARAGAELRADNPAHKGDEEYNWFLAVIFPKEHPSILPYHRLVKDLNGLRPAELLDRLRRIADVRETVDPEPRKPGSFCMYVSGKWHLVTLPER